MRSHVRITNIEHHAVQPKDFSGEESWPPVPHPITPFCRLS
jgi:hypothetical protein